MATRQKVEQTNHWGPDGHPARGLQQKRRTSQPMSRETFLRNNLGLEFAKVLHVNGIPSGWCDQESLIVQNLLAEQLRKHMDKQYLLSVEIVGGETLGQALDKATKALAEELNRRRLERVIAEAARA